MKYVILKNCSLFTKVIFILHEDLTFTSKASNGHVFQFWKDLEISPLTTTRTAMVLTQMSTPYTMDTSSEIFSHSVST